MLLVVLPRTIDSSADEVDASHCCGALTRPLNASLDTASPSSPAAAAIIGRPRSDRRRLATLIALCGDSVPLPPIALDQMPRGVRDTRDARRCLRLLRFSSAPRRLRVRASALRAAVVVYADVARECGARGGWGAGRSLARAARGACAALAVCARE